MIKKVKMVKVAVTENAELKELLGAYREVGIDPNAVLRDWLAKNSPKKATRRPAKKISARVG